MYDPGVKREDLSPNDPRAVIEDPQVVREEAQLRIFARIFMFGLQIAAIAMLIVLVVPPRQAPDSFPHTLRTVALHATWIALLIAFSGPILKLIHYLRSRR